MPFDHYEAAHVTPGRTVPVEMTMLPKHPVTGKHPVAHVEHLGNDNRSWIAYQIETADPKKIEKAKTSTLKKKQETLEERTARAMEQSKEKRDERRAEIRHAVRHIDAWHSDGTPATDDDVPAWIGAIPQDGVDLIWWVATNLENYRNREFATEQELAEK